MSGVDAGAFSIISGSGTQTIPANGSVSVQVKFTGSGQLAGRKNATLTMNYTYQGNSIGTQSVQLTGAVISTPIAQLYLDDTLLTTETTSTGGNSVNLTLTVDHPYSGNYADQTAVFPLKRTGSYVLASDFGGEHNSTLMAERQRYLDQLTLQGFLSSAQEVQSESLNIIGQSWLLQTQLQSDLVNALADNRQIKHHRFGIVGQESGYFVDIRAQMSSTLPQSSTANRFFVAGTLIDSAMEHAVLEQLQGSSQPALSTIKVFTLNNQNSGKFFLANASNFATVLGQLTGYTASDINNLQIAINNNATLILPQNGQISLNNWQGQGYMDYRDNGNQRSLGMIISGGLNGGYSSYTGQFSTSTMQDYYSSLLTPPSDIKTQTALDPVDLGSGAYLNHVTDLGLGGAGARGLNFTRSYNSQQVSNDSAGMGKGWNHNYYIRLDRHSDVKTALGLRAPQDAAALIVAAYVNNDLMSASQPSLQAWTVGALVAQWATDQLQDKAVTIQLGDRALTFQQTPDGSYISPPSVTTQLIKNSNGTYQLKERFGTAMAFDSNNRLQSLTDIDGNAVSLTYTGDLLTQIKDAYSRSLTLSYTTGKLTQVADNQGRSVSYAYTGNDLTSYHDAENKAWQYGYDANHQILTVTDPTNNKIVNNTYDAFNRVSQ